eukprot:8527220-Ditylum_brightwellii.AAC.2
MNYNEAMTMEEKGDWYQAALKEHKSFCKYQVWKSVLKSKLPEGGKVLTLTWAMKPKPNGVRYARLNAHGFEQVDGLYYDGQDLSAPVVNDMTIRIVCVMIILAAWTDELLAGPDSLVKVDKQKMMSWFECKAVGEADK